MSDSFRPQYLTQLPTPLAQFYHRCCGDDVRLRHENLSHLFEAAIKLSVVPSALEYIRGIVHGTAPRDKRVDKELLAIGRPMLGQWVGMLRELARYFEQSHAPRPHPLAGLAARLNQKRSDHSGALDLYCRIKNGVDGRPSGDRSCSLLQVINVLVSYRNAVKGHSAGDRPAEFYEAMVPLLFAALNDLLSALTLEWFETSESGLVQIREIRHIDESQRAVEILPLVGLVPIAKTQTVTVSAAEASRLARDSVGFRWPKPAPLLGLSPLLIWGEADGRSKPLVFNGGASKPKYACFEKGTSVERPEMRIAIGDLLSAVGDSPSPDRGTTIPLDYSLLPYLVDRDAQERRIQRVLEQELDSRQPRAVVFILSGEATQCHDKFKSRLVEFTLRKLYGLDCDDRIDDAFIRFPLDEHAEEEYGEELHWLLADKFSPESTSRSELVQRMSERAVLIYSELNTSDWDARRERQIEWFLRYWQQLPAMSRKPAPVICLAIKYVAGLSFWDRRRRARRNERARKWLSNLSANQFADIRLEVMPELPNVKRGDVDNWRLKFERELKRFPNAHLLEPGLDRLFQQSHEFSMQKLAPALRELLERSKAA